MNDKYALITGASSGIGYETAKAFAAKGFGVIIAARRESNLERLRTEILAEYPDTDVVLRVCDLSSNDETIELYNSIQQYNITLLVNNAGRGNKGGFIDDSLIRDIDMLHLNMDAVYILSSLYARDHKDTEGAQIINVSSIGGYLLVPGSSLYCATKFFVSALTEAIDLEMRVGGHKLRAKVIAPTSTETEYEQTANELEEKFDYAARGGHYFTATQMAEFIVQLYESDATVASIDFATRELALSGPKHPHFGG